MDGAADPVRLSPEGERGGSLRGDLSWLHAEVVMGKVAFFVLSPIVVVG